MFVEEKILNLHLKMGLEKRKLNPIFFFFFFFFFFFEGMNNEIGKY